MPLILGTNSIKDTGFDVANSCRFEASSSQKMVKTLGTPTSTKIGTVSCWVKRGSIGVEQHFFGTKQDGNDRCSIGFDDSAEGELHIVQEDSGSFGYRFKTTARFRDPSAWLHLVLAIDTTQASASNRVKIYINGTQVTDFATETQPSQDTVIRYGISGEELVVGAKFGGGGSYGNFYSGYLAEVVFIDGQQLDPTSFGEFDSSSNIWKPKDVSGLTFGNNGFYLDFEDSSNLGNDANGGTDLTESNLSATNQSTDTCTNNFATFNPLMPESSSVTFSEGNLKMTTTGSGSWTTHYGASTIAVSSGKWYIESKVTTTQTSQAIIGIVSTSQQINSSLKDVGRAAVERNGRIVVFGANNQTGLTTFNNGDIAAIAFDADNGTAQFYRNGSTYGSAVTSIPSDEYYFATTTFEVGGVVEFNFGAPAFSISSGNSDAEGFGNFEYAVPSGYFALCTKNLAEYG